MWVRNQNKELLQNFNGFSIAKNEAENSVIYGWKDTWMTSIGFYQSEKRCEEIMNELQECLNEMCPYVYQIPEDNGSNMIPEGIAPDTTETITMTVIRNRNSTGWDEIYCEFFKCPVCNDEYIQKGNKYCPECGTKIKWELK